MKIPLLLPVVPDREALWPYLGRIDQARHYSNFGPLVRELESRLAQRFKSHTALDMHVATVSSATLGIELALATLDLPPGSAILVPALTFVATLTAVIRAGHTPVVADIDLESWLLTPGIVEAAIRETGAKAALVVATFSQAQDSKAWGEFQQKTGVRIVIDAAGAFGNQWVDAGDIPVVFSMHATKSLTAGEGGFVVCANQATTDLVREMSNFGINLDVKKSLPVGYLSSAGTNAKLSEFNAAVALASLDAWDKWADVRDTLYTRYRERLESACGSSLTWQKGLSTSPMTFSVRVGSNERRNRLETICAEAGIATRRWYQPLLHQHAAKVGPIISMATPTANKIAADLIGLPFFAMMSEEQMAVVVDAVKRVVSSV